MAHRKEQIIIRYHHNEKEDFSSMRPENRDAHLNELSPMSFGPNGFTIIELLVAMVVSSFVIVFVLSMYSFAERIMAHQLSRSEVREAISGCTQRIMADIELSTRTDRCDDTSLVLQLEPLKEIKYHFDVSRIWRNGMLMNAPQTELIVHVSFDEDTICVQPKRFWNISVVGSQGNIRDSADVSISTIISSQEMVNRTMNQTSR